MQLEEVEEFVYFGSQGKCINVKKRRRAGQDWCAERFNYYRERSNSLEVQNQECITLYIEQQRYVDANLGS